jgi:hypothetical protein
VDSWHRLRLLELQKRRPEHAQADHQQQHAQNQTRSRFEPMMAVRVLGVCFLLAVVAGKEHDEIGNQIRQRVDAVGDQALRLGKNTRYDLGQG